jgi:DHA1 family tetracycline resistance protein-like MFS transporter
MEHTAGRRASVAFIFITILLDMLALGIIIPVLPKLIEDFLNGDAAKAAQMIGVFGTAWALMQFVFAPVLGILSDQVGRRPIVLLSNFGLGADYMLMALAPTLSWLFVGRVISGITSASISAASGYIADVTPAEKRSSAFGLLGMAFGAGFILGPAVGGFFGHINPRLPFLVAGALSLLNAAYGFFILPESLKPENRTPFSWRRANPLGSIRLLASTKRLYAFSEVTFLLSLAHVIFPSVMVIYMTYRYGWTTKTVGLMMAVVGISNGFVQGVLVAPAVRHFKETTVLLIGLVFGTIGFAMAGLAADEFWFWLSIPFLALWGLANAVIQGLMSAEVGGDQQGYLQGAIGSLRGIAELIGPGIFTFMFAYFIEPKSIAHIPGAPFYFASFLIFLSIAVLIRRMSQNRS